MTSRAVQIKLARTIGVIAVVLLVLDLVRWTVFYQVTFIEIGLQLVILLVSLFLALVKDGPLRRLGAIVALLAVSALASMYFHLFIGAAELLLRLAIHAAIALLALSNAISLRVQDQRGQPPSR